VAASNQAGAMSARVIQSRQMGWTAPSGIDAIMRVVRTGNKGAAHDEH
jgi:hypothetical protein